MRLMPRFTLLNRLAIVDSYELLRRIFRFASSNWLCGGKPREKEWINPIKAHDRWSLNVSAQYSQLVLVFKRRCRWSHVSHQFKRNHMQINQLKNSIFQIGLSYRNGVGECVHELRFFFQLPHARWLKKNRNYLFQNLIFSPSKHSTRATDVRNEESASSIFYFFVCTILSARRWTRSSVSTRFFLFSFLHLVAKCLTWTPNCRWYERSPIISISLSMFVEPKKICINEVEKSPQQQQQMRKIRCTTIGYDCRAAITKFIAHIMKWRRCYFRPTYE